MHNYSGTSNKGPAEKGTTSLQRILPIPPKVHVQYISTSEKKTTFLQGIKLLVPKCPLLRGSITVVYVYLYTNYYNCFITPHKSQSLLFCNRNGYIIATCVTGSSRLVQVWIDRVTVGTFSVCICWYLSPSQYFNVLSLLTENMKWVFGTNCIIKHTHTHNTTQ